MYRIELESEQLFMKDEFKTVSGPDGFPECIDQNFEQHISRKKPSSFLKKSFYESIEVQEDTYILHNQRHQILVDGKVCAFLNTFQNTKSSSNNTDLIEILYTLGFLENA